jgi:hypothetical protein
MNVHSALRRYGNTITTQKAGSQDVICFNSSFWRNFFSFVHLPRKEKAALFPERLLVFVA